MSTGLRERKRLRAMRTIQENALDLFDERGFDAVTIEEIAAASEVSASSIYRYFGTKEGLIVADEFDMLSDPALDDLLDLNDPVESLRRIVRDYEVGPGEAEQTMGNAPQATRAEPQSASGPWRRVRYFFQEPSVRLAVYASLDRASHRIAPVMSANRGMTDTQARVAANALVFGYAAALEQWYLDGCAHPIVTYIDDGMLHLRRIWTQPTESENS